MNQHETEPMAFGFLAGATFLIFALIAMQWSCASVPHGVLRPHDERQPYAVSIRVVCVSLEGIGMSTGSGVRIDGSHILTAHHVIDCDGDTAIAVRDENGYRRAVVDRRWKKRDLARLRLDGEPDGAPRVEIAPLAKGDGICSSSVFPAVRNACGEVQSTYATLCPQGEWCHNASYAADIVHGNSGSAAYDAQGALVGIVTGGAFVPGTDIPFGLAFISQLWPIRDEIFR